MQFTDRLTLDGGLRRTQDGYAVASAKVARGGNVQTYLGAELGMPERKTIRVFRPADEVFKREAMASYAGVPITFGHPKANVTADTWKQLAVGEAGDEVMRDGEFVRVPIMLRDAIAIASVETGIRELSMGYEATVTMQDGVSPAGETFDAVMTNYRMNHVAIVDKARGGEELRIGDGAKSWGAAPVNDHHPEKETPMTLKTVIVDGIPIEVTDQGAQVIATLQARLTDAHKKTTDTETAMATALAAKATELAAKDTEIGTLKADKKKLEDSQLTPAAIDAMVSARATLVGTVKAIDAKIDVAGKTNAELIKAAVAAKLGDDMVKDASEATIAGMFAAITKDVKPDPYAETVKDGIKPSGIADAEVNTAYAQMLKDMQSGTVTATAN